MRKIGLVAGAALLGASLAGVTVANAYPVTSLGFEDPTNGLVTTIFGGTNEPPLDLASDGEAPFMPFGITYDVSDAVRMNPIWSLDPASGWTFFGADANGNNIWDLPAIIPGCGNENEPRCEPLGIFDAPGFVWTVPTQAFTMWDSPGVLSDVILIGNFGPNGSAQLIFSSDPNLLAIPEASTWAMMLLGFAGLGYAGYRSRSRTPALAV